MSLRVGVPKSKPQNQKNKWNNKGKDKTQKVLAPKGKNFKGIKGACWVCGKIGHRALKCRHKKGNSGPNDKNINKQANIVEEEFVGIVFSEANLLTDSED